MGRTFQGDAWNAGVIHSNDLEHCDVGIWIIDVDDGGVDSLLAEDVDKFVDVPGDEQIYSPRLKEALQCLRPGPVGLAGQDIYPVELFVMRYHTLDRLQKLCQRAALYAERA